MRILVKGTNWLGDAVMSLPALASLRAMRPRAQVTVLTKAAFADLYRGSPDVDDVLLHERGGVKPWVRTVREIKRRRFDAAVILPRSFSSAFLVFSARVPRRVGYGGDGRRALLTEMPDRLPASPKKHRVHHFHHLLTALGDPPAPRAPKLELLPDAVAWAREQLPEGPWIAVNPGATYGDAKQWFPDRYIELARRLRKRGRIVTVGGPSEAELGATVADACDGLNLAGRTSISQLAAVLARAELLVTNDTGPMHVGDAVGTPIVAVFGPTDWIETPPYGRKNSIVRHDIECSPCLKRTCPLRHHNCMKEVGVDEVHRACLEWLR